MAYRLLLNGTKDNWRLHVDEDPDDLEERLRRAPNGETVRVQVVLQDDLPAHTLYVNPQNLAWWAVIYEADPS